MRDALRDPDRDSARPAALGELGAEPALAGPGLGDDAEHLTLARRGARERRLEQRHLGLAADEPRQPAYARDVEAAAQGTEPLEPEHLHRRGHPLQVRLAQVPQREVAGHDPRRLRRDAGAVRARDLLQACGDVRHGTLRGVVHAQVVADLPHHDFARVDPDPRREVEAPLEAQLVGEARELVAQLQRREARALRVVLVRDRRAEQRHDPVAGVLIHRAFVAVYALGEDLEEAIEQTVPVLGVELRREIGRALHVGEQHRHLLALALERRARGQDLVREVPRRVGARVALEGTLRCLCLGRAALGAEPRARDQVCAARRTARRAARAALGTELRRRGISRVQLGQFTTRAPPRAVPPGRWRPSRRRGGALRGAVALASRGIALRLRELRACEQDDRRVRRRAHLCDERICPRELALRLVGRLRAVHQQQRRARARSRPAARRAGRHSSASPAARPRSRAASLAHRPRHCTPRRPPRQVEVKWSESDCSGTISSKSRMAAAQSPAASCAMARMRAASTLSAGTRCRSAACTARRACASASSASPRQPRALDDRLRQPDHEVIAGLVIDGPRGACELSAGVGEAAAIGERDCEPADQEGVVVPGDRRGQHGGIERSDSRCDLDRFLEAPLAVQRRRRAHTPRRCGRSSSPISSARRSPSRA